MIPIEDKERFEKIFSDIGVFMKDLDSMKISRLEELRDRKNFYASSMIVMSAINSAINLGEEMLLICKLGTPSTYKDIFFLLLKGGLISRTMKDQLSELSSYRNMSSHEYSEITEAELMKILGKINVVNDFAEKMRGKLKFM